MRLKILVVDDEEATRKLLGSSFKDEGCDVREASGGYQALFPRFSRPLSP